MLVNKSLALRAVIPILTLLLALSSAIGALGGTYVGFYKVINWPVISVSLINGTYASNGIIIVISPEVEPNQQYEAFSGIGLIGGGYFLVNGIIYVNGTISIMELTPINSSMGLGIGNNETTAQLSINITAYPSDYEVVGQRTYHIGQLERGISITAAMGNVSGVVIHGGQTTIVRRNGGNATGEGVRSIYVPIYVIINSSLTSTIALIVLLIAAPSLLKYQVHDDRECINDLFVKVVRRLGVRDPSLTHRDIRNYLTGIPGVNNGVIDEVIHYYEMAIYGNKPIKCEEFKRLIEVILNAGVRGRN